MRWNVIAAAMVAAVGLAASQAHAAVPPPTVAKLAPTGTAARPMDFSRIAFRLNTGERIGSISSMPCILFPDPLTWQSDFDVKDDEIARMFQRELSQAGFKAASDANNLFERTDGGQAEFAVGGLVTKMNINACYLTSTSNRARGDAQITVEWQIYSRLKREVVGKVESVGSVAAPGFAVGGGMELVRDALADSVRGLINSDVFRQAALGAPGPALVTAAPTTSGQARTPIAFAKPTRKPAAMSDVVGSVVTVMSGDGHGSGFLISDDGYVLTNQHVTAGAKYVKIRWSDKFESVGEVIREEKGRDVALIKTDSRGRTPLSLRRATPDLGLEVYAVGAPLEEALQGTVTRGIVSANNRVFDNYAYIQSDVTVNPGNSGGPLVTKEGDVLGLTVSGLRPGGAPTGINLFIPAGDALDFLGLK